MTVITNSTTGESAQYVMYFNSTDRRWHLHYTAPELGMRFGKVVTFSFQASDEYKNSGSAANAYVITVGADTTDIGFGRGCRGNSARDPAGMGNAYYYE